MDTPTIFIIEDDVDTREMLGKFLELEGYHVETASNGRQALDRLASGAPACVIVLDLMMPVMDGFEFLHELRSREDGRSVPVVVVTAKDLTPADRDRLRAGVENVIQTGRLSHGNLLDEIRANLPSLPLSRIDRETGIR